VSINEDEIQVVGQLAGCELGWFMDDNLLNEIHQAIKAAGGKKEPAVEGRYHKHTEYVAYGLKTSDLWAIMKGFKPRYMALNLDQRLALSARLLGTGIGEPSHGGIYLLGNSARHLEPDHLPYLDRLIDDFHSWSHVDHFCGSVLQSLFIKYPEETYSQLERWTAAENRFRRRTSVVVFTRKVAKSGMYTAECLAISDKLIWDREDIVRKGVGWALKDNMASAPDTIMDYVKNLRRLGVSSTITLYAIQKLEEEKRQEILAIKKGAKG